MFEIVKIVGIERLEGYRLHLRFSDGTEGEHDFSEVVSMPGPMVAPLQNSEFFGRAFLQVGNLTWPNGFDLDSIALHQEMKSAGELKQSAAA
jgi:hypothetical protein